MCRDDTRTHCPTDTEQDADWRCEDAESYTHNWRYPMRHRAGRTDLFPNTITASKHQDPDSWHDLSDRSITLRDADDNIVAHAFVYAHHAPDKPCSFCNPAARESDTDAR